MLVIGDVISLVHRLLCILQTKKTVKMKNGIIIQLQLNVILTSNDIKNAIHIIVFPSKNDCCSMLNNKVRNVRASAMSFSNAFDMLNQNLLCQLKAYGLDANALASIQSYFSKSKGEQFV